MFKVKEREREGGWERKREGGRDRERGRARREWEGERGMGDRERKQGGGREISCVLYYIIVLSFLFINLYSFVLF